MDEVSLFNTTLVTNRFRVIAIALRFMFGTIGFFLIYFWTVVGQDQGTGNLDSEEIVRVSEDRVESEIVVRDGEEFQVRTVSEWYDDAVGQVEAVSSGLWRQYSVVPGEGTHLVLNRWEHWIGSMDGNYRYQLYIQLPAGLEAGDVVDVYPISSKRADTQQARGKVLSPMNDLEATAFEFGNPHYISRTTDDDPASIGTVKIISMSPDVVTVEINISAFQSSTIFGEPVEFKLKEQLKLNRRDPSDFVTGLRSG